MGALQGASMLLGPFGFGVTAYEYIHKSGGDLARVSAIEPIAQERTKPIHEATGGSAGRQGPDRARGSGEGAGDYHDKATSDGGVCPAGGR